MNQDNFSEHNQSEWNQQINFSYIFFTITNKCRLCQMNRNFEEWYKSLESKISCIQAIINEEEKIKVKMIKDELYIQYCKCLKVKHINNNIYNDESTKLGSMLFVAESDIDTMTNKYMPFLNIKKRISIKDL